MLRLMRIVDRATGCIFVPAPNRTTDSLSGEVSGEGAELPRTKRPNIYSLFTSAAGPIGGIRSDVRDVQERWLEAKDEWDEHETEIRKKEMQQLKENNQKGE
jgi:GPN-loop GTPase